jgi:hypothetical protein
LTQDDRKKLFDVGKIPSIPEDDPIYSEGLILTSPIAPRPSGETSSPTPQVPPADMVEEYKKEQEEISQGKKEPWADRTGS